MSTPETARIRAAAADVSAARISLPVETISAVTPDLFNKASAQAEKSLRLRLGIPENQPIPAQIKQISDSEIKAALATNLAETVRMDAGASVKGTLKGQTFGLFDERIKTAVVSAEHIRGSGDVANILKQKAELMFAKKKAYTDAGFTSEEAMDLILAETRAKSGA